MLYIFLCTLFAWFSVAIYSIVVKRRFIGLNLFVLVGIYLPMALYFLGWSAYVDNTPSEKFYFIFACLNICLLFYNLLVKDTCKFNLDVMPVSVSTNAVLILDFIFVLLFFIESYMGSGSFVPAFVGIDIHAYSAPVIAFVTRNLFLIVSLNLITYLVNKKKKYLLFSLGLIVLPAITRNMRISSIIAVVQIVTFFGLYYSAVKRNGDSETFLSSIKTRVKKHKSMVVVVLILASIFTLYSVSMTNDRMNQNGKYDLDYTTLIAYTGPEVLSNVIPVYYGYFPLSFNNLNLSLKYGVAEHNYIGLYSFSSVYFGLLQFDNVFGLDTSEPSNIGHRVSTCSAATVATGFWDYWYDYGYLCFIPIAVMVCICAWITKRLQVKPSLFMYLQYCHFIPLVFFESFQNLFFSTATLYEVIFALVLVKLVFRFKVSR